MTKVMERKNKNLSLEHQEQSYFQRMAVSIDDKSKLIENLVPGRVLDVGAGGGELSKKIAELGHEVWALDGSDSAIKLIKQIDNNKIHPVKSFAEEAVNIFPEGFFQNIVCSSIMHEIFSYGTNKFEVQKIHNILSDFNKLLSDGGRLLIRDGVIPNNSSEKVFLSFTDENGKNFIDKYSDIAPFWMDKKDSNVPNSHVVYAKEINSKLYKTDMKSTMEILYTYTWGEKSLHREGNEIYGVFKEKDYIETIEKHDFKVLSSEQYLQQGYVDNLAPKVKILSETMNKELDFPSTNMLIVAVKG